MKGRLGTPPQQRPTTSPQQRPRQQERPGAPPQRQPPQLRSTEAGSPTKLKPSLTPRAPLLRQGMSPPPERVHLSRCSFLIIIDIPPETVERAHSTHLRVVSTNTVDTSTLSDRTTTDRGAGGNAGRATPRHAAPRRATPPPPISRAMTRFATRETHHRSPVSAHGARLCRNVGAGLTGSKFCSNVSIAVIPVLTGGTGAGVRVSPRSRCNNCSRSEGTGVGGVNGTTGWE